MIGKWAGRMMPAAALLLAAAPASAQLTDQQKWMNIHPDCTPAQYAAAHPEAARWGVLARIAGKLWKTEDGKIVKIDWEDCATRDRLSIFQSEGSGRTGRSDREIFALNPAGGFLTGYERDELKPSPIFPTPPWPIAGSESRHPAC